MKLLILIILFIGIIFVIQGIYDEKIKTLEKEVKIEYRFIPRSYYDEQLFSNQFSSKFSTLFDEDQNEWSANRRTFKKYTEDELNNMKKDELNNMKKSKRTF